MKKIISVLMSMIMIFSLSSTVFAYENVDNTFDNFTPAPGEKAPDNWYDPYCYESDGRINKYCLNKGGSNCAIYCPEYKKIFTITFMGRTTINGQTRSYVPYNILCKNWTYKVTYDNSIKIIDLEQWFCPYCGKYKTDNYTNDTELHENSAIYSHPQIASIVYGYHCDKCDTFVGSTMFAINISDRSAFEFDNAHEQSFGKCHDITDVNSVKLYRFLNEEQQKAEYSFIFAETEADFGDGKDGNIDDLKMDKAGNYIKWDSPDNPYSKPLTFWQKIKNFFKNIFEKIASIFS